MGGTTEQCAGEHRWEAMQAAHCLPRCVSEVARHPTQGCAMEGRAATQFLSAMDASLSCSGNAEALGEGSVFCNKCNKDFSSFHRRVLRSPRSFYYGSVIFHVRAGRQKRRGSASECKAQGRFNLGGGAAGQAREEDVLTLQEMSTLSNDLLSLKGVVVEGYRGIGPDMRDRVNRLYDRASMLKESADRMVAAGGRVPAQLTATLKALQREHGSLENIVRFAMEAGPVISSGSEPLGSLTTSNSASTSSLALDEEQQTSTAFQSLIRESDLEPVKPLPPAYVMTSPAANESSPLAAFRAEIERRVMEQLVGKRVANQVRSTATMVGERETVGAVSSIGGQAPSSQDQMLWEGKDREAGNGGALSSLIDDTTEGSRKVEGHKSQEGLLSSVADAERKVRIAKLEGQMKSMELDKLRGDLAVMQQEVTSLKQEATRADLAEEQVLKLKGEIAMSVPLEMHEQTVGRVRESLSVAWAKVTQITGEVKEKEAILAAVKQALMAEQEKLVEKVRELSGELAKRVTIEDMEAAINSAVEEVERALEKAEERALALSLELEKKDKLIVQLQANWNLEKDGLCSELASVKKKLASIQKKRIAEQAQLLEAQEKVRSLESSSAIRHNTTEADEYRGKSEHAVLATVRSLITDMVKAMRAKSETGTEASTVIDAMEFLQGDNQMLQLTKWGAEGREGAGGEGDGMKSSVNTVASEAINLEGTLFPAEKAVALEKFFVIMAMLIKQASDKLDTDLILHASYDVGMTGDGATQDGTRTKPTITLQYESSWESVYLHYCADDTLWTEIPGVLLHNRIDGNGKSVKMLTIPARSLEFVLTDGNGSWDCAPAGGNYRIGTSGTFFLSCGIIEQRK